MATQEQERRSPPLETAKSASDEPQLPGLVPTTGGSAATMATGDMAAGGGGAAKEEERGLEVPLDNVRSSSPSVAPLSVVGGSKPCSSHIFASPQCPHFQRKPRSHVHRAAPPSHQWGFKLPVLPPAPAKKKRAAKKRDKPCAICGATKTPLWRTWPTDRRVMLCNSCGIRVRAPGTVLPELVYLPHPATATTTAVSELEQPVAPAQEIQPILDSLRPAVLPEKVHVYLPPPATARTTVVSELEQQPPPQEIQDPESPPEPDSPILESMKDVNVYLLRRTSLPPPPPPQTAEPAPAVAVLAAGNEGDKPEKWCLHCGTTSSLQWRMGPLGESTLCNPCGVRYRQGRLVPEYRPRASPTFNQAEHAYKHREVLKIREKHDHPAPPPPAAALKPIRIRTRKRRNGKGQQQQPAQVHKKHKGNDNKAQNQAAAQAQPAPAATQQRAGNDMLQNLPPPPLSPPAEPVPAAAAAAAPGNDEIKKPEKWCLHCGITSTLRWRTGPLGESTLCNACGVRYRQGRLVPEYRPRASPTFNESEHSYKHHEVLEIRKKQDHPAPPASFKLTKRRRKGAKGQQQPDASSQEGQGQGAERACTSATSLPMQGSLTMNQRS